MSIRTTARRWGARLAGERVREIVRLPDEVARLRAENSGLQERLARLEADLHEARVHAGRADDAIARLTDGLDATSATLERDLAESRRLSHRVAQMTDVVFDRLAERPGAQPA